MPGEATILHADLDSFYASVEQRDNPELRGKPVIVGGGVVVAASYEAKARGVNAPMNGAAALRACPDAVVVPPRMSAYSAASKEVFAIFNQTSPMVEALSIDEAFLDVGGMEHFAGSPREIAEKLRRDVLRQAGLPITVGVATTKFLAKVASAYAKPDGLLVIEPGTELEFLHPLAIERLWGVGPVTAKKLRARGVKTVGDIARLGEDGLTYAVGQASARHLNDLANNRDPRPPAAAAARSVRNARIRRRKYTYEELDAMLVALVDRVARRLRKSGRAARTVTLSLRFNDFSRATRSHTVSRATSQSAVLLAEARQLLQTAMPKIDQDGITLIGVAFDNLDDGEIQLELDLEPTDNDEIDATVDAVLDRFGAGSITRGVLVDCDEGIVAPVLPD